MRRMLERGGSVLVCGHLLKPKSSTAAREVSLTSTVRLLLLLLLLELSSAHIKHDCVPTWRAVPGGRELEFRLQREARRVL